MTDFEKEIAYHKKALAELQRLKAQSKLPKKIKSDRPRGRPRINEMKIKAARELAKNFPIRDVALRLGMASSTLYIYGIKRKILNAEKDAISKSDLQTE